MTITRVVGCYIVSLCVSRRLVLTRYSVTLSAIKILSSCEICQKKRPSCVSETFYNIRTLCAELGAVITSMQSLRQAHYFPPFKYLLLLREFQQLSSSSFWRVLSRGSHGGLSLSSSSNSLHLLPSVLVFQQSSFQIFFFSVIYTELKAKNDTRKKTQISKVTVFL